MLAVQYRVCTGPTSALGQALSWPEELGHVSARCLPHQHGNAPQNGGGVFRYTHCPGGNAHVQGIYGRILQDDIPQAASENPLGTSVACRRNGGEIAAGERLCLGVNETRRS